MVVWVDELGLEGYLDEVAQERRGLAGLRERLEGLCLQVPELAQGVAPLLEKLDKVLWANGEKTRLITVTRERLWQVRREQNQILDELEQRRRN